MIAGVSCGQFGTVRHKRHCQLPSGEPLVIGRRGWIPSTLSGKDSQQQTKDYNLVQADIPLKTNKLRKDTDAGSGVREGCG